MSTDDEARAAYTPTTAEVREAVAEWMWSRRMFRSELSASDDHELDRWMAEQGYSKPREADTDDREELAHIVKRVAQKFGGPSLAEFANDPPIRKHYSTADAIQAAGYSKQHPPTDAEVERAAKAMWVAGQDDRAWAESVVDDVFSPADDWPEECIALATLARAALGAVRPAPEPPTVEEWIERVAAERARHSEKGYGAAHDREHGADHLLNWAIDYSRRGEAEKSSSLIAAARDVLRASHPAPEPEWEYGIRASGDEEPYSDISEDFDWLMDDGGGASMLTSPGDHLVRRRPAGPWEPAPKQTEGEPR